MSTKRKLISKNVISFVLSIGLVLLIALAIVIRSGIAARFSREIGRPSSPSQILDTDLVATWNVYEEEELGFSIRYPKDWYFQENPDFQEPRIVPNVLETKVMFANFPPPLLGPSDLIPDGCRFNISLAETDISPAQQMTAEGYKGIDSLSTPSSETLVVINGIEGIRRIYSRDEKSMTQTRTIVLLPGSNNLFEFYFWKDREDFDCENIFETMLQTFSLLR